MIVIQGPNRQRDERKGQTFTTNAGSVRLAVKRFVGASREGEIRCLRLINRPESVLDRKKKGGDPCK